MRESRVVRMRWRDSVAGRVERNSSMRRQQMAKPTPLGENGGHQRHLFLFLDISTWEENIHTCWLLLRAHTCTRLCFRLRSWFLVAGSCFHCRTSLQSKRMMEGVAINLNTQLRLLGFIVHYCQVLINWLSLNSHHFFRIRISFLVAVLFS